MKVCLFLALIFFLLTVPAIAESNEVLTVLVDKLHCEMCGKTIKKVLEPQTNITEISVSVPEKKVYLTFPNGESPDEDLLVALIGKAGYRVLHIETS